MKFNKYYDITNSEFNKKWLEYGENFKELHKTLRTIMEEKGAGYEGALINKKDIALFPIDFTDEMKKSLTKKSTDDGAVFLRKNSKLAKEIRQRLEDEGCKILDKPRILNYIGFGGGKISTSPIELNGRVLCKISSESDNYSTTEDFVEIQESEYLEMWLEIVKIKEEETLEK